MLGAARNAVAAGGIEDRHQADHAGVALAPFPREGMEGAALADERIRKLADELARERAHDTAHEEAHDAAEEAARDV